MTKSLAETARDLVGVHRNELELHKSTEWCAEGTSYIIANSNISDNAKKVQSISCNDMYRYMTDNPEWAEPDDMPKVNDIAFFDWNRQADGGKPLDHVGVIIEIIDGFTVKTVEGNTTGDDGINDGRYHIKTRTLHPNETQYPDKYMRYTGTAQPQKIAPDVLSVTELEYICNDIQQCVNALKNYIDKH